MSWGRERWIAVAAVIAACGGTKDAPSAGSAGSAGSASAAGAAGSNVVEAPLPGASGRTKITETTKSKVVTLDEPKLDLPAQESFRLLDPGTGPRQVLRYGTPTQAWAVALSEDLTTRHLIKGAWSAPAALPRLGFAMRVRAVEANPDRLVLRFDKATSASETPDAQQRIGRWNDLLAGRLATVDVDHRGGFKKPIFSDDPLCDRCSEAREKLTDHLLSSIMPLPEEPVGLHASWRVITVMKIASFYGKQTATYTLTERSQARWKIHIKLQRVAEEQRVDSPTLPPGTTMDLLAMFSGVEADAEIDPTRPIGAASTGNVEQRMHIRITRAGDPATASEQMFEDTGTTAVRVEP